MREFSFRSGGSGGSEVSALLVGRDYAAAIGSAILGKAFKILASIVINSVLCSSTIAASSQLYAEQPLVRTSSSRASSRARILRR